MTPPHGGEIRRARHAPTTTPHGDLGFALPPPASVSRGRVVVIAFAALAILGAAFAVGYLPATPGAHGARGVHVDFGRRRLARGARYPEGGIERPCESSFRGACSRSRRRSFTRAPTATCASGALTSAIR